MKSSRFIARTAKLLSAFLIFFVALNFASCKHEEDSSSFPAGIEKLSSDNILIGKWIDAYSSVYEISKNEFKNYGEGTYSFSGYEGNNLLVGKISSDSGYIYIKYTKSYESLTSAPYYQYSTTAPDVGKWYAISYKDLKNNSLSISGAYKSGGKTSTESLEEAIKEFTIDNEYFSTYSTCSKSN